MLTNVSDDSPGWADATESVDEPVLVVRRVRPAYEQVAAQLRDLIIRGELAAGDRLPVESELPTLFGVSRSTIREALRVLSSQNLITTRRGVRGGTFVVKPEPDHVREVFETSLGLMVVHDAIGIDELIEVREMLEVPAARWAASRRTQAHVKALHDLAHRRDQSPSSPRDLDETRSFHEVVLHGAGNALLDIVAQPIFRVLDTRIHPRGEGFRTNREGTGPIFWNEVSEDHLRIAEAIEARDEEAAAESMLAHLEHLRVRYQGLLSENKPAPSKRAKRSKTPVAR